MTYVEDEEEYCNLRVLVMRFTFRFKFVSPSGWFGILRNLHFDLNAKGGRQQYRSSKGKIHSSSVFPFHTNWICKEIDANKIINSFIGFCNYHGKSSHTSINWIYWIILFAKMFLVLLMALDVDVDGASKMISARLGWVEIRMRRMTLGALQWQ